MSTLKKILLGVVLLAVVAVSGLHFFGPPQVAKAAAAAPPFTVTDLQGNAVSLSSLQGKPVFINFWATWCPPCVGEMPDIQRMYSQYGEQVHFVIINIDGEPSEVQAFMAQNGYTFPAMLDTNGAAGAYSVQAIPASYLIDASGNLLSSHIGSLSGSQMESFITAAL